ncbi:MAG: hypothetical protein J5I98_34220, partial [Phaeodactylibacter sp.]|nr:hypothetical protein [Phaeodactylibacter sp.]
ERTYILEIDTTALFDSPLKRRTAITQRGGVIKWSPTLPWQDSAAYFWRISPDSTEAAVGFAWEGSSFTYIEGSPEGWGQGGYWQWLEGEGEGVTIEENRLFSFDPAGFIITVKCKNLDAQDPPAYIFNFDNPAASVRPWNFMDEGIAVVVGDSLTGAGWINSPGGLYGSVNANSNTRVFGFPTGDPGYRENLIKFLDEVIPPKSYVILFTVLNTISSELSVEDWARDSLIFGKNIFSVLAEEGARLVRSLEDLGAVHYAFMYQKGAGVISEGIASSIQETLTVEGYFPIKGTEGTYETGMAGPVLQWKTFNWQVKEKEVQDIQKLDLIGINQLGEEAILADSLVENSFILNNISASDYPYLKARFYFKDTEQRTSPQIQYCHFLYDGKPEVAVNPINRYNFHADTLQQGEVLHLTYSVESLNTFDLDSLLIQYNIKGPDNEDITTSLRIPLVNGNTALDLSFQQDTKMLMEGNHTLSINVNPEEEQPEQTLINNFFNIPFYINTDKSNPVLNVTFDGQVIMDGDLVSPRPEILISLKDENSYFLLDDTSLLEMRLIYPDGNIETLALNNEQVQFFPAQSETDNEMKIRYTPSFKEDGIYRLAIQGRDRSGNLSGRFSYEVNFEVITKNSISNILNYPNPFSTSTQFVYTLTGQEPHDFRIQIMTVSGRIVREIAKEEIGMMRVGTHRTEFTWNGTDEYGSRLANGVYLYRVIARDVDGKDYEIYENGSNSYFKKGFGKLVILR